MKNLKNRATILLPDFLSTTHRCFAGQTHTNFRPNVEIRGNLTSGQLSSALRPFYFAVHPDFFEGHPDFRQTNENSLKLLNGRLSSLQSGERLVDRQTPSSVTANKVKFYLLRRPVCLNGANEKPSVGKAGVDAVEVDLKHPDTLSLVRHVLEKCQMSTKSLPKNKPSDGANIFDVRIGDDNRGISFDDEYLREFLKVRNKTRQAEQNKSFEGRLQKLVLQSEKSAKNYENLHANFLKRSNDLCQRYGIESMDWNCGWTMQFCHGYLVLLEKLLASNSHVWCNVVGWNIRFGNQTYVSVDGWLVLGVEDTPEDWQTVLSSLLPSSAYFVGLTDLESELSSFLGGARVGGFAYDSVVRYKRWLNALNDRMRISDFDAERAKLKFEQRSKSSNFDQLNLIVVNSTGSLILTDAGAVLVPSSALPAPLCNFLSENYDKSVRLTLSRRNLSALVTEWSTEVTKALSLQRLSWENHANLEMVHCCLQRMSLHREKLRSILNGRSVKLGLAYKVEFDGTIVVPVDFMGGVNL